MNREHEQSIFHVNLNLNLMEQNIIQINDGITISVDVTIKKLGM